MSKHSPIRITFDSSAKELVLSAFDKAIDEEGYLVEGSDMSRRIIAQNGQDVTRDEFAGIRKGSQIFIKSDMSSLIRLADDLAALRSDRAIS